MLGCLPSFFVVLHRMMLTTHRRNRTQRTTMAMRSSGVSTLAWNFRHDHGHRWVKGILFRASLTGSDCPAAQIHSVDVERLRTACREPEMREGLLSEPNAQRGEDDLCLPGNRDHHLVFGPTESRLPRSVSDKYACRVHDQDQTRRGAAGSFIRITTEKRRSIGPGSVTTFA